MFPHVFKVLPQCKFHTVLGILFIKAASRYWDALEAFRVLIDHPFREAHQDYTATPKPTAWKSMIGFEQWLECWVSNCPRSVNSSINIHKTSQRLCLVRVQTCSGQRDSFFHEGTRASLGGSALRFLSSVPSELKPFGNAITAVLRAHNGGVQLSSSLQSYQLYSNSHGALKGLQVFLFLCLICQAFRGTCSFMERWDRISVGETELPYPKDRERNKLIPLHAGPKSWNRFVLLTIKRFSLPLGWWHSFHIHTSASYITTKILAMQCSQITSSFGTMSITILIFLCISFQCASMWRHSDREWWRMNCSHSISSPFVVGTQKDLNGSDL